MAKQPLPNPRKRPKAGDSPKRARHRCGKVCVIPSGYPKVLLSTKELSAVQEAILDVIRTQRQGAVKPSFTGCTFRPGWLLISCANRETADWLKAAMPKLKLWPGAKVELVADADMPKPQVYIGHFPKTEKYSNEDILQLLEGQNSAPWLGDWRILNRVDRGNILNSRSLWIPIGRKA
ncbi:hypothetical protein ACLKA7_000899 [Drosophila subpalustris]